MNSSPSFLLGDEVHFEHDSHAYRDADGSECISVTQAIQIAGLIDYSMVRPEYLEVARRRGDLVHQACALADQGEDLNHYVMPDLLWPYISAYLTFVAEMKFVVNPDLVERRMIVDLFGHRIGMTPDAVGTIDGVPTLIERKAASAAHPSWAIQTAGYQMGLRAARVQVRQRMAVQLLPTAKYRVHVFDDETDAETFAAVYRIAAWKRKHNLAKLAE